MRWLDKLVLRFRSVIHRNAIDQELSEELCFHLERQLAENVAAGMTPEEAAQAAYQAFGGVERFKDECRDTRGTNIVENLLADLRYGLRSLRRSPGFTLICL